MYENLIQRQPLSNKPSNLSIRLSAMPVNEKVAYVESVCAALIDARFGRRWNPFIMGMSEFPEFEDEVFDDRTVDGQVPFYTALPDSAVARRDAADIGRRELSQSEAVNPSIRIQSLPTSNLGRDSPQIFLGRMAQCQ